MCEECGINDVRRAVPDCGEPTVMSAAEPGGHVQQLLGAYVLGGLPALEEALVRAHLNRCALCRAEHDELACVPSWLDLLTSADAATGLDVPGTPKRGRPGHHPDGSESAGAGPP